MSDFPDWFSNPIVLNYGTTKRIGISTTATPNGKTILHNVSAKGILYVVGLRIDANFVVGGDSVRLNIDGKRFQWDQISGPKREGRIMPRFAMWYATRYDDVATRYKLELHGPIPFSSSIELIYRETYGREPVIASGLVYTDITD